MGEIHSPEPVTPIIVAFSAHAAAMQAAQDKATKAWGPIGLVSPLFHFAETDYYEASMGAPLTKQFWCFTNLADPQGLADWKRATNAWEEVVRSELSDLAARPVNLDAGYLDLGKFVLGSTKDHAHRIYLRDGIFGEVTLHYSNKAWQPRPWTFPDYQRTDYRDFLLQARKWHQAKLRQPHANSES